MTQAPASSTSAVVAPEELRTLFLFEQLSDSQLQWLSDRGERCAFGEEAVVYREGDRSDFFFVLLEGTVRLVRSANGDDFVMNETSHRGTYAGAIRAFVSDTDTGYPNSLHAVAPSSFFRLPASDFKAFMYEHLPMAVHLLEGLYIGIRNSEAAVRQREHLAKLGKLSASLAHELNNPAAAAVRATAQLRDRIAELRSCLDALAEGGVDREAVRGTLVLQEAALARSASAVPLSTLQQSDEEDAIADRLEELGLTDAYDLAAVFAAAGLDADWVAEAAGGTDGAVLERRMRWLATVLETQSLMDEITHSTGAISTLVEAVKQYSYMDSASVQDVDVNAGIESTLVMLGHKLQGVDVQRDYDPALPRVQAYGAELNQVWTNLIDNAAQAMAGRGTLTLRTAREEDAVVVEVADEGPGIPPEIQARVFDAFFTSKSQGRGSGLGLDNARRIVEGRHRGTIGFTTGPHGTVFRVTLPVSS